MVVVVVGVPSDHTPGAAPRPSDVMLGNIILLAQCAAMGGLLVGSTIAVRRVPHTTVTALYYSGASVLTAVCAAATVPTGCYSIKTAAGWAAVVFGIVGGWVALLSWGIAWFIVTVTMPPCILQQYAPRNTPPTPDAMLLFNSPVASEAGK